MCRHFSVIHCSNLPFVNGKSLNQFTGKRHARTLFYTDDSKDYRESVTLLSSFIIFTSLARLTLSSTFYLTLESQKNCHLRHVWIETSQESLFWSFSNEHPSDLFFRIATPSFQIRIMSPHFLEPTLSEHLLRCRSSRHPSLASRLVRNGITVMRKKCSEASPLEVWEDHCSFSICPNI